MRGPGKLGEDEMLILYGRKVCVRMCVGGDEKEGEDDVPDRERTEWNTVQSRKDGRKSQDFMERRKVGYFGRKMWECRDEHVE